MTKRQTLDYDSDELTKNLKQSAGQGVDALFSPSPSEPDEEPQASQPARRPHTEAPETPSKDRASGHRDSPVPRSEDTAPETTEAGLANRTGDQSTSRSTAQSTDQSSKRFSVVSRPKAFYITEALHERINRAVDYFKETHGITKADRSAVVTAMLEDDALWTEEALDRLVDRLVNQLARR